MALEDGDNPVAEGAGHEALIGGLGHPFIVAALGEHGHFDE